MATLKSEIRDQRSEIRRVIGCMTGTSLDGLDAALVEIAGRGLEMKARFIAMTSLPLGALREELRHFASGGAAEPIRFMRAARRLGELHAAAVADLCCKSAISDPRSEIAFVVAHGQTIWHAPEDRAPLPPGERVAESARPGEGGASEATKPTSRKSTSSSSPPSPSPGGEAPPPSPQSGEGAHRPAGLSWQLFDPWPIVRRLGVPVCYDLRQADLIAGGQGAPITPISDWIMYRRDDATRVIVNLGGICNVTILPRGQSPEAITGGDIGPCNLLIDGVVRVFHPELQYDEGGQLAAKAAGGDIAYHRIYGHLPWDKDGQPRSLGREQFTDEWVRDTAHKIRAHFPEQWQDISTISSVVEAVAVRLAVYLRDLQHPYEIVLAGGGARNNTLVRRIEANIAATVLTSDQIGIPIEAREAMGFAVLGALSQDGVPITLPAVTGAVSPGRAGAWVYP